MKKIYYSCPLYYRPSFILNQQIIIGVLYIFVEEKKLFFDFPTHLRFAKQVFSNTNLDNLRLLLEQFQKTAAIYSGNFEQPEHIIQQIYGEPNSASFVFDAPLFGYYRNLSSHIQEKHHFYFQSYLQTKKIADTQHILTQLELLFDQNNINRKLLKNKPTIADVEFDYSWKNGATNFIKPLSFDYQLPAYIGKKANEWIGKIVRVKEKLFSENLNLDFFTSPPQKIDFKPIYQDALQSLKEMGNQTNQRVHFYESKDIPEYVANLAAHIHS